MNVFRSAQTFRTALAHWGQRSFMNAFQKGFHTAPEGREYDHRDPARIATRIALIHAELSEALEEAARGRLELWYDGDKPEGLGIELADAFLRLADLAESVGIDLDEMVRIKHEYNLTRPLRHGGKRL